MRKIGKILAVLIIILVVLVTIIAIALPRYIDLNAYHGYLQSLIKSTTGKDVVMGTMGISLWSGIKVYATDIQVTEKKEDLAQTVLKAEKISAQIAFWPLLRKKIRINNIIVHSPEIDYEIGQGDPFGSLLILSNIGSLVGQGTQGLPMEKSAPEGKSDFLSSFILDTSGLGHVVVKEGTLEMHKRLTTGELLSLGIERIYLNIDQSQAPPSFLIDAEASFPERGGDLKIHGTLEHLEEKKTMPFQIFLDADISKARIFSKHLLSLTGVGVESGRMNIKTEISGSMGEKINIHSEGMFGDLLLEGSTAKVYQGKPLEGTFSFKGNIKNSILGLEEIKIHIGQSVISIEGTVDLKEARPMLRFSIQGKAINYSDIRDFMSLFQFQPPSYIKGGILHADLGGKAQLGSFSIQEITGESVLDNFTVLLESLPAPIENIHCQVKISKHTLDFSAIKALFQENPIEGNIHITNFKTPESSFDLNMLGGRVTGTLFFPRQEDGGYLLGVEVEEINMNSFISTFVPDYRNIIHGKLTGKMQIRSSELFAENIMLHSAGSGSFQVKKGKITTFGLLNQVGMMLNLMGGKGIGREETPFDTLEGEFQLMQGDLKIENLFLKAPDITLRGEGRVDQDSQIDFSFHANFSHAVSQAMVASTPLLKYRMDSNGELSFPLKVEGNINKPKVSLDLNKILKKSTKEKIFNKIKSFLDR